jgi:hypothetical protein
LEGIKLVVQQREKERKVEGKVVGSDVHSPLGSFHSVEVDSTEFSEKHAVFIFIVKVCSEQVFMYTYALVQQTHTGKDGGLRPHPDQQGQ